MNEQQQISERPETDDDLSILEIAAIFARNFRLLLAAPMLGGTIFLAASFLIAPEFTSSAQIMVPQQQSSASAMLGSLGGLASSLSGVGLPGVRNPADQWISLLKSRTVADAIISKYSLKKYYASQYDFQARNALAANTRISVGKDGLISIEFDDQDPKRSKPIVETYISELQKMSKQLAVTEAAQRRVFFEKQLTDVKEKLISSEIALKGANITDGAIKTLPTASIGAVAQLQAQISALEIALRVKRESQTDTSPEIQITKAQITALREELQKQRDTKSSAADQNQTDYISAYRNFKYYETMFEMMARQFEAAKIDEARDGALIQVVDAPIDPEYKSSPKRGSIAVMGAGAMLLLAILLILLQYSLKLANFGPIPLIGKSIK